MIEKILYWATTPETIQRLKENSVNIILIAVVIALIIWCIWYLKSKRRRRHIQFHLHHLSVKLGFRRTMSRKWVGRVHVNECFDPLVIFLPHKHIIFNEETLEQPNLIRKNVLFKLYKIADKLPDGVNLLILNTFRSKAKMNEAWVKTIEDITKEKPGVGRNEAMRLAKFRVADPKDNMGGHETGGAIDVALCDDNGKMFDYGTAFHEYNGATFTKNNNITKEQMANRKRLLKVMRKGGFVNFPAEWWHFSYGDRTWAAYKGKRNGGIYGSAEIDIDGDYKFTIPVNKAVYESRR